MISCVFDGQELACLIDTGATASVLNSQVWDRFLFSKRRRLKKPESEFEELVGIGGTPIKTKGVFRAQVYFPCVKKTFTHHFLLADLGEQYSLIIGYDFLRRHLLSFDTRNQTLIVHDRPKDMMITCQKALSLPPRSEIIVPVQVQSSCANSAAPNQLWYVEPTKEFECTRQGPYVGRLVSRIKDTGVKILNLTNRSTVIQAVKQEPRFLLFKHLSPVKS